MTAELTRSKKQKRVKHREPTFGSWGPRAPRAFLPTPVLCPQLVVVTFSLTTVMASGGFADGLSSSDIVQALFLPCRQKPKQSIATRGAHVRLCTGCRPSTRYGGHPLVWSYPPGTEAIHQVRRPCTRYRGHGPGTEAMDQVRRPSTSMGLSTSRGLSTNRGLSTSGGLSIRYRGPPLGMETIQSCGVIH